MILPSSAFVIQPTLNPSKTTSNRNQSINKITLINPTNKYHHSLEASRSICTFDADDFTGKTGDWPYTTTEMARLDPTNDAMFYDVPRFVTHIDDRAIESLTAYYEEEISAYGDGTSKDLQVLDLCSSWISHYPKEENGSKAKERMSWVVGIGMNEEELARNDQLNMYYQQDLNINPSLSQFQDSTFDIITNVVSVDYLTQPKEIFKEMHRILKPGGISLISFSNRCFPSKAVATWLQEDDIGRMSIVGSYYHYSAEWSSIEALDIKLPPVDQPKKPSFGEIFKEPGKAAAWMNAAAVVNQMNNGDPMYIVKGVK